MLKRILAKLFEFVQNRTRKKKKSTPHIWQKINLVHSVQQPKIKQPTTFVVSRAVMAGAASQAGDADSSQAAGLTSGLQGSMNVHRSALLLAPQ